MRILVAGELSGRAAEPVAGPDPRRIDLDNFDEVLRRYSPWLQLRIPGAPEPPVEIEFSSLDDFHPDRLYRTLPLFAGLRSARARVLDPTTSGEEAAALLAGVPLGGRPVPPPRPPLAGAAASSPAAIADRLVRSVVETHVQRGPAHDPAPYLAALDAAASESLRRVLHHPDFQRLEAAWRAIRWLVESLELGEDLELMLLDVARDRLPHRLAQGFPGREPSHVVVLYTYGADVGDADELIRLAQVLAPLDALLLAAADRGFLPDCEHAAAWQQLRHTASGSRIALACPRILLRLPYGTATEPVESFAFEEFAGTPAHEDYLWGSPAVACALLAAQHYIDTGDDTDLPSSLEIENLPAHVFVHDGESQLQACAEYYMSTEAAEAIHRHGITPLVSFRDRNAVRVLPAWPAP